MRLHQFIAGSVLVFCIPGAANAFEFDASSEIAESEFNDRCVEAFGTGASEECAEAFSKIPDYHSDAEEKFFETVLNLNAEAKRANANDYGTSNPRKYYGHPNYATALGYSLNADKLEGLSFALKLKGVIFGKNTERGSKYRGRVAQISGMGNFIYTYEISKGGKQLATGKLVTQNGIVYGEVCDAESKVSKCRKRFSSNLTENSWVGRFGGNGLDLAIAMMKAKGSPFADRVDRINFKYFAPTKTTSAARASGFAKPYQSTFSLKRLDVGSTVGTTDFSSAQFSSAKAPFTYAKMGLFDEVELSGPAGYLARANSDVQYKSALEGCIAQMKADNRKGKSDVFAAAGTIGSLFGLGGASRAVRAAKIAAPIGEVLGTLAGEDKRAVDSCMSSKGYSR